MSDVTFHTNLDLAKGAVADLNKIYFAQRGDDGPIKIGRSNKPEERIRTPASMRTAPTMRTADSTAAAPLPGAGAPHRRHVFAVDFIVLPQLGHLMRSRVRERTGETR